jgi:hypothetical protein
MWAGDLSLHFYLEEDPVLEILVEVAGTGNPLPVLRKICNPNGWLVLEEDSSLVDLACPPAPAGRRFSTCEKKPFKVYEIWHARKVAFEDRWSGESGRTIARFAALLDSACEVM